MSKRRLERDLETLGDEILPELSADERLSLLVEATAEGNEHRCERLIETCPQPHRVHTDFRFTMGFHFATLFAAQAVYDLHTTYLHYRYLETVHWSEMRRDFDREEQDAPISDERLERATDRAETLRMLFVRLYTTYHTNRRFAEEILEVDFETWLADHPDGSPILEFVEGCLAESSWDPTRPTGFSEELTVDGDDWGHTDPPDMDRLVDEQFNHLVAVREDLLETAEPG